MQENTSPVLTLEWGKRITMTGVTSVDAFSDSVITLTVAGKRLRLEGSKLKILSFSEASGSFAASGEISSVKCAARPLRGLLK